MDDLKALAKLINDSVGQIVNACEAKNVIFPELNEPFTPESEAFRADKAVSKAANVIIGAAAQLIALVRPVHLTLTTTGSQFHTSSVLGVAIDANVAEILREAGPSGLHVQKIAEKSGQDSNRIARILRLLATEHIFREISPDVFTNNRISSALDTGKNSANLLARLFTGSLPPNTAGSLWKFIRPSEKHVGTDGFIALLSLTTNFTFKSSSYLKNTLQDPEFALSNEPTKAAFCNAFRTNLNFYDWLKQPGNETARSVFNMAMAGATNRLYSDAVLQGLDWKSLPPSSVVVDVAGGVGSQSLLLVKAHPHLKIVLQDLEPTLQDAKAFWEEHFPEALHTGQVTLQTINFFASQPIKNAAVYFMRFILHNWADSYCVTILSKLRESAAPGTQLLILDRILDYSCNDTSTAVNIPGATKEVAPLPLLPNYGHASAMDYFLDLIMMTLTNGQERTLSHVGQILEQGGWVILKVFQYSTPMAQIVAVPK